MTTRITKAASSPHDPGHHVQQPGEPRDQSPMCPAPAPMAAPPRRRTNSARCALFRPVQPLIVSGNGSPHTHTRTRAHALSLSHATSHARTRTRMSPLSPPPPTPQPQPMHNGGRCRPSAGANRGSTGMTLRRVPPSSSGARCAVAVSAGGVALATRAPNPLGSGVVGVLAPTPLPPAPALPSKPRPPLRTLALSLCWLGAVSTSAVPGVVSGKSSSCCGAFCCAVGAG